MPVGDHQPRRLQPLSVSGSAQAPSSRPPLLIEVGGSPQRRTLAVRGEVDIDTAPQLQATLQRMCVDGACEIVLDLQQLRFIDSSGIQALLAAKSDCAEQGCALIVDSALPEAIARLFELTGVTVFFS